MIEPAKHIDKVVYPKGTTKDIMTEIMSCYNSTYMQVMPICDNIDKNQSVISICKYVFDLVNDNITYKEDPTGKQLIRTPARLWADKTGDCKSFAIFIGSCMRCLGIPHVFRFASYTSNPDPTHVYIVAYDGDKEIIVDPVYRVRGIALFNQECIYKHKKDMAGTTQISRLSGIGYPGQTTQSIYPTTNIEITRSEANLYFNLNLLSRWYNISMKNGKTEEAEHYLNLMDLCSSAINCFNLERDGVITLNQGLTFLLSLYNAGRFNTPINATQEEREAILSVIYSQTVTESGNYESDSDSYGEIYKITGDDLVGNLLAISGIGRISKQYIKSSTKSVSSDNEKKVSDTIYESAEYFTYTMIPESELSEYPEIVSTKRAEHLNILKDIQDSGYANVDQCRAMITTAIEEKWGMTPAMYLRAIKRGDIPIIGTPLFAVIIGVVISLISALAPILIAVFDKDQFAEDVKLYAPSADDGIFTAQPSYDWNTGGSGFTTASDYLLPLLLIGGLVVGLSSSSKKKKKKKKKR